LLKCYWPGTDELNVWNDDNCTILPLSRSLKDFNQVQTSNTPDLNISFTVAKPLSIIPSHFTPTESNYSIVFSTQVWRWLPQERDLCCN